MCGKALEDPAIFHLLDKQLLMFAILLLETHFFTFVATRHETAIVAEWKFLTQKYLPSYSLLQALQG